MTPSPQTLTTEADLSGKPDVLTLFVVYDHPKDFPDHFVVRKMFMHQGEGIHHLHCTTHESLEEARRSLPEGLHNLGRDPQDDVAIAEVWI